MAFPDRDNRLGVDPVARLWQVVMRELPDRVLALEVVADFVPGPGACTPSGSSEGATYESRV